ncbi:hypothetical protein GBAR_LOCUS15487 [Geodia barretti]|uniref:G-protein coupled receptors family 1 profile domain-containing protein n=1 Tax=Geodia barretti TaxID=519541 RepID=A0AA35SD87_GEOBA|nr:hypothetical protein GBAR_LOCUS15487 [Geodia barretti]
MNAAYALLSHDEYTHTRRKYLRVRGWRIVIAGDCAIVEAVPVGSGDSRMDHIYTDTAEDEVCRPYCHMDEKEEGEFNVVAVVRLITAFPSFAGALSIVCSAVYRKTLCNPKVHPIFVLSIVDTLLSILWITGALVWLKGDGLSAYQNFRVGCFTINCMTVILQCIAMNVTLIYALLAYSSIKQRDFSGFYMVQQRPGSVHVWPPVCSFTAYSIAWTLPIILIMIPFGVISQYYKIVDQANNCSCWCLPFYGNVLPHPQIGHQNVKDNYRFHLHRFIMSYSVILILNFTVVFCCMAVIYFKVFRRIKHMSTQQENNNNATLYGATQAMILAGQKDAKKRVFIFFTIYIISGVMTFVFGLFMIVTLVRMYNGNTLDPKKDLKITYTFLLLEAIFVPSQGFMNAVAYGWTRGDFLSVMSTTRHNRLKSGSIAASYEATEGEQEAKEEEEEVETDDEEKKEDWEGGEEFCRGNSILFSSSRALDSMTGGRNIAPF